MSRTLNVDRMRRHRHHTMPTRVSQPVELADLTRNPYLFRWAQAMAERFGPWTVHVDDRTDPAHVTFTATIRDGDPYAAERRRATSEVAP